MLRVVICWHMHQPQYCDPLDGRYRLPWTYLHATKDYIDMAAHLERHAEARAVVNFSPTLIEQIADYDNQIREHLHGRGELKDPLLIALDSRRLPTDDDERTALMQQCLRAQEQRMIRRFPAYAELADLAAQVQAAPSLIAYLDEQYFADLLVWFHLAWLGETVRRDDDRARQLLAKQRLFDRHDRRTLLRIIGDQMSQVLPRYRRLVSQGRVELSMSPYAHPMLPLLLDPASARDAVPDLPLPEFEAYPGGEERVAWHLQAGKAVFKQHFDLEPSGCWPSEGGVSAAAVDALGRAGFQWFATGESVLRNSLRRSELSEEGCLHRPWRVADTTPLGFFRDDGLSDLIGFNYSDWHADDAVSNLIHHLENIAEVCADEPDRVVSIILDGENAWEHYPDNGLHFLSALYGRLGAHPSIELTTFERCIADGVGAAELPQMVAGSWVYGSFTTWMGDADKNRAWDLLYEAKLAFDRAVAAGRFDETQLERATRQLAVCEGSDWFWWFGDYNPGDSVSDFDRLYRHQLTRLYLLLGERPPAALETPISQGGGSAEHGGVMRRGQANA